MEKGAMAMHASAHTSAMTHNNDLSNWQLQQIQEN
jgi:hypothetical protein